MAEPIQGDSKGGEPEIKTEPCKQRGGVGQVGASGEGSVEVVARLLPEEGAVNVEGTLIEGENVGVKTESAGQGIGDGQSGPSGDTSAEMAGIGKTELTDQGESEDAGQIPLSGGMKFEGETVATDEATEVHESVKISAKVNPSGCEPTDTALETLPEKKSIVAPETTTSHKEKIDEGEGSIVDSDQKMEEIESERMTTGDALKVEESSETVVDAKPAELGEGKEGSHGVDVGSGGINMESPLESKHDKVGSDGDMVGSSEVMMELGEMGSDMGPVRDSMELEEGNMRSEVASMEAKVVSDEGEIGSVETSIPINVSDVDTAVDNVKTSETLSQKEEIKPPAEIPNQEKASTSVDSISEESKVAKLAVKLTELSEVSETQVGGNAEKEGVELSESRAKAEAEIPLENDSSLNINPEAASKPDSVTTSIDANETVEEGQEPTDEV